LKLWTTRNLEVKGETPEKAYIVHRTDMINEILHIQLITGQIPATAQELIFRDATALRTMKTSTILSYLYGARMIIEASFTTTQKYSRATIDNKLLSTMHRNTELKQ
jgi:hypothetical protein